MEEGGHWMGSQSWVRAMRTATTTTATTTVKPALKPTRVRTHSWIHSNNATPKAVRDRQGSPPPQHPHSKNSSIAGLSLPLSRIRTLTHTHTQKENKILAIPTTCKNQSSNESTGTHKKAADGTREGRLWVSN